ncbi:MAG: hypothetical protein ACXWT1_12575 [Methylobacter sp.]
MSNQFAIVPCSVCSGSTLLKTALVWKDSIFCSADCLRNRVDSVRLNNELIKKAAHDKFFSSAL